MVIYITATLLSLLFAYVSSNLKDTKQIGGGSIKLLRHIFAFLSFLPLTFIMAVRYDVGTDYISYLQIYLFSAEKEAGYIALNNFLNFFTADAQAIFIASAIIICGSYFYMIYKESISPVYSVLLFVLCKDYFIAMNGMRQYISTAIVILAIPFVKRKEWFMAAVIFLIAFSFHKSVIVFLVVLVLYFLDIKPWLGGILIVGTLLFSNVAMRLTFSFLQMFDSYTNYFLDLGIENSSGAYNWRYSLIFICFFFMLSYEYKKVKENKELKLMYAGILFSLFAMALVPVMPKLMHRLTWHMNSLIVLYTPQALKSIQNRKISKFLKYIIPIAYVFVTVSDIMRGEQGVLPYQTIWH